MGRSSGGKWPEGLSFPVSDIEGDWTVIGMVNRRTFKNKCHGAFVRVALPNNVINSSGLPVNPNAIS